MKGEAHVKRQEVVEDSDKGTSGVMTELAGTTIGTAIM